MRVFIADAFPPGRLEDLRALGLQVELRPEVPPGELAAALGDAEVLVVRSKQVGAAVFERAGALSLVVRAGAGTNTIDVAAASRRGVHVANCPGQNAAAVAELALGLMLSADRRIPDNVVALREGRWDKKAFSEARGLRGRTLGIAGLGSIGHEVARRALAFGLRVVAWSRSLDERQAKELGIERAPDLRTLAAQADILSLHLPLAAETRGLVTRGLLEAMPSGALLVNTARAELVDEGALVELVRAGRLRAAVDVHSGEPQAARGEFRSELAMLPGVVATHHIGASTEQAQDAIARETVRIIATFLREGAVPNCVNVARRTPARCQLVVRHFDKVGVLANVLGALREADINVHEMENTVFEGAVAASCRMRLDARPPTALLDALRARTDEIIHVDVFDV